MVLTLLQGTLNVTNTTGLQVTGLGSSSITLTGSLSDLNTSLTTLSMMPPTGYTGSDTLSMTDEDTSTDLIGSFNVAMTVSPLQPVVTAPSAVSTVENGSFVFTGANAISVADPSATPSTNETMTLTVQDGTLSANTSGVSFTGLNSTMLTLSGPIANLNASLATLSYTPNANTTDIDTLNLSDLDTADSLSGTASVTITVGNPVPVITAPASITAFENTPFAFAGANAISVADTGAVPSK